jgi:hypothetical protein
MIADLILHKDKEWIRLVFGFDDDIKIKVRSIDGATWSKTNKAWLLPNNTLSKEQLKLLFPDLAMPFIKKEVEIDTDDDKENRDDFVFNRNDYSMRNLIRIFVNYRYIKVKCPKNEKDIQFFRSIKYCYWKSDLFYWEMPNSVDNFEMIKIFFGDRIDSFEVDESIPVRKSASSSKVYIDLKNKVIEAEELQISNNLSFFHQNT